MLKFSKLCAIFKTTFELVFVLVLVLTLAFALSLFSKIFVLIFFDFRLVLELELDFELIFYNFVLRVYFNEDEGVQSRFVYIRIRNDKVNNITCGHV